MRSGCGCRRSRTRCRGSRRVWTRSATTDQLRLNRYD
jgi:hypothetical protein